MGLDVVFSTEAAIAAGAPEFTVQVEVSYDPDEDRTEFRTDARLNVAGWEGVVVPENGHTIVRAKTPVLEWLNAHSIPFSYC